MRPTETESARWENHRGSTLLAEFTLFRCTQLHPVEGRCTVLFCLTVESNMLSHKGFRSKRLAVQWLFDTQEVRGSSPLSPTQFGTEKVPGALLRLFCWSASGPEQRLQTEPGR